MTTNKQLVLDHLDRISTGDLAGAAALLAEDCQNHSAIPTMQGRAGFVAVLSKIRVAFPDLHYTVEDVVADGDRVVVRVTATGTHRGKLAFARLPLEPTNKAVRFEQIHIARVANERIVEHWLGMDSMAMFRQLGLEVVPATA